MYEEYLTVVKRSETDTAGKPSQPEPEHPLDSEIDMDEYGELAESEDDLADAQNDTEAESLQERGVPVRAEELQSPEEIQQLADEYRAMTTPGPPKPPAPPRPLMTAEIVADATTLKAFTDQVKVVADEAKVCFERDGIRVSAVDPAHVQLVELTLPHSDLETYDVLEDGHRAMSPCELGLDFEKLSGVLAKHKGTVSLAFRFGGVPKEKLEVVNGGSTREMGVLDTAGMTDPKIPVLVLPAKVALDGNAFLKILKSAGKVSDHIAITVTPTALRFVAEGDVDAYKHEFQAGTDEVEYLTQVTEEYRSLFPLDYLLKIAKTVKESRLILSIGTDFPLRIEWDGPHTRGTFLTAPRIEYPD